MTPEEAEDIARKNTINGVRPVVVSDGSFYFNHNVEAIRKHCVDYKLQAFGLPEITEEKIIKKSKDKEDVTE